jgi:hypothetical protein
VAVKKLKYKDIFTEGMGLPKNDDMGSATKPPKQDMGAGAGRGKQGGPTAKQLSDYELDDTVYREGKGPPPKNPDTVKKYAKGGMVSSSRGNGIAVRGKTRGRLY